MRGETAPTSVSPSLEISSVVKLEGDSKTLLAPCKILTKDKIVGAKVLIDCGAGGEFINYPFARKNKIKIFLKTFKV